MQTTPILTPYHIPIIPYRLVITSSKKWALLHSEAVADQEPRSRRDATPKAVKAMGLAATKELQIGSLRIVDAQFLTQRRPIRRCRFE